MVTGLDFGSIPPISVIGTHFKNEEEDNVKATLRRHGATLATDLSRAKIFIGRVGSKKRALFELRARKFKVEEVQESRDDSQLQETDDPPNKRRKLSKSLIEPIVLHEGGTTTEEDGSETAEDENPIKGASPSTSHVAPGQKGSVSQTSFDHLKEDLIWVIKVDWLDACLTTGHLVALSEYQVLKAKVLERPARLPEYRSIKSVFPAVSSSTSSSKISSTQTSQDIPQRPKVDASAVPRQTLYQQADGHGPRESQGKPSPLPKAHKPTLKFRTAHLLQQTTSEYEGVDTEFPPPPDWVKKGIRFSCQRFTPIDSPNEDFIAQLKKIRTSRILIEDKIGVRAYSTIIASIAAYPHKLTHPRQLAQLPGCDEKAVLLFIEWKNTGTIREVEDFEKDEEMKILRSFYDIWGVGAKTARTFVKKHWTEIDDIIEFGWDTLDRVQQIGTKYYDEFLKGIPRPEVEHIADIVRQHAVRLRDDRISVTIAGGYRRGKQESGDVDLIVSHPNLSATAHLVEEIVDALEQSGWITHILTLSLHNTHRNQTTLPFRSSKSAGSGFDTLDKALVVWQDPVWLTRDDDLAVDPNAKNPNVHRRVDIIVSPWRTVGCALLGWSGGTTFQRDLRRYAKEVKGWKFDSSGIRSRKDGEVVMLEGPEGVDGTPGDAERRVFEGLGLEFVPPEMRCTN